MRPYTSEQLERLTNNTRQDDAARLIKNIRGGKTTLLFGPVGIGKSTLVDATAHALAHERPFRKVLMGEPPLYQVWNDDQCAWVAGPPPSSGVTADAGEVWVIHDRFESDASAYDDIGQLRKLVTLAREGRITLVVVTTARISGYLANTSRYYHYWQLLGPLGPVPQRLSLLKDKDQAYAAIDLLAERFNARLSSPADEALIFRTGGPHPGHLAETLVMGLHTADGTSRFVANGLVQNVKEELADTCYRRLWQHLSVDEKEALEFVASATDKDTDGEPGLVKPPPAMANVLMRDSITWLTWPSDPKDEIRLYSGAFAAFVCEMSRLGVAEPELQEHQESLLKNPYAVLLLFAILLAASFVLGFVTILLRANPLIILLSVTLPIIVGVALFFVAYVSSRR